MLIAMAVMGMMTYSLLLTHPPLMLSLSSDQSPSPATPHTCGSGDKTSIWKQLPECKPRNTLVKIPLPNNPNVLNVVPNQVELARCAGTCHTPDGLYQRCMPESVANTSVQVMYETSVPGEARLEEVCASLSLEVHTSCSCGCQQLECSSKQQEFDDRTCECRCSDIGARGQCLVQYNKLWDPDSCECRCRPEEWKECQTGYTYDGVYSCQCLPGSLSAAAPVMVILSVLTIVFLAISIGLYVKFTRTKRRLEETLVSRHRDRLFPQTSYT